MIIKLKELLEKIDEEIPIILYHGTFNALVPEIELKGLIPFGTQYRNYEDIDEGVYLTNDWNFAGSMVESTENTNIPDGWIEEVVILAIDTRKLDKSKFDKDPNVNMPEDDEFRSYIYRGNIPPDAIMEINDYT